MTDSYSFQYAEKCVPSTLGQVPATLSETTGGQGGFPWEAGVGCVDWRCIQWQAAYKATPFAVVTDSRTGGRRIHVHEFPDREYWQNEDLGRNKQTVDVHAFVFGDRCDLWAEELFFKCTDGQVGQLSLPLRTPVKARCLTVQSTFVADAMGRIEFNMQFVLEAADADLRGNPAKLPPDQRSVTMQSSMVSTAATQLTDSTRDHFETAFTGAQPHVGRRAAAETMKQTGQALRRAGRQARMRAAESSKVAFAAKHIDRNADTFADGQRTAGNKLTATMSVSSQRAGRFSSLAATQSGLAPDSSSQRGVALRASTGQVIPARGSSNEGFGGVYDQALRDLSRGSPNPRDLEQALVPLTSLKPRALVAERQGIRTPSILAELQLAETVATFVRLRALAEQARAIIRVAPEEQPGALTLRQRLLAKLQEEGAAIASRDNKTYEALRGLHATVADYIAVWSRGGTATKPIQGATGRPLITVTTDVYHGTRRQRKLAADAEMMRLNGITHPLFCPEHTVALK